MKSRMTTGTSDDTVRYMTNFAIEGRKNLEIRMKTEEIVRNIKPKDKLSECLSIYYWFMDTKNFRYVEDIAGVETLKKPDLCLKTRQGDCDDIATLIASMLLSINIPCQFVKVGFSKDVYSHVLTRGLPFGTNLFPVILDPVAGSLTRQMRDSIVEMKVYPIMDESSL